jgi:hypothetical protein
MADPLLISRHEGFSEWLHTDDGDQYRIVRTEDVGEVLDANRRQALANPSGMGAEREWQHVARIPVMVQFEWIKRYGADPLAKGNEDLLKRLLNDPEWRWIRTSEVIV